MILTLQDTTADKSAKTDVPALWIKKSKRKLRLGPLLLSLLLLESKRGYTALTRPVSKDDILDFRSSLMNGGHKCGTAPVIRSVLEVNDKSGLPPIMQDILHLDELTFTEKWKCSEQKWS